MNELHTLHDCSWDNAVSLGCFCGIAQELESFGLRSCSLPFDWLISDSFKHVLLCINNGFDGFLTYENLAQFKDYPKRYFDTEYQLAFFHDFNPRNSLRAQLKSVQQKYQRRIAAFYRITSQPTLFFRYCSSSDEVKWINDNHDYVMNTIKRSNPRNEIVFITDIGFEDKLQKDMICFEVEKDPDDVVCKKPLHYNQIIADLMCSDIIHSSVRQANQAWERKSRLRKAIRRRKMKIISKINAHLVPYKHEKQVSQEDGKGIFFEQ